MTKKEAVLRKLTELTVILKAVGESTEDGQMDFIATGIIVTLIAAEDQNSAKIFMKHINNFIIESEFLKEDDPDLTKFIIQQNYSTN